MDPVKLTRAELYELVWSTPMRKLAAEYGLSDVGLAKTCDRWEIPRPGRGYWAQIAAGQKPRRSKLPNVSEETERTIVLHRIPAATQGVVAPPDIIVADKLTRPHPAVTWLDGALKKAESDKYGRLIVGGGGARTFVFGRRARGVCCCCSMRSSRRSPNEATWSKRSRETRTDRLNSL